jgi:hypothetical protein
MPILDSKRVCQARRCHPWPLARTKRIHLGFSRQRVAGFRHSLRSGSRRCRARSNFEPLWPAHNLMRGPNADAKYGVDVPARSSQVSPLAPSSPARRAQHAPAISGRSRTLPRIFQDVRETGLGSAPATAPRSRMSKVGPSLRKSFRCRTK